jgi:hypothetical protein
MVRGPAQRSPGSLSFFKFCRKLKLDRLGSQDLRDGGCEHLVIAANGDCPAPRPEAADLELIVVWLPERFASLSFLSFPVVRVNPSPRFRLEA